MNISKQDGTYAAYVQECVELLMEHGTDIRLRVDKGPGFPDNGKTLCGMDQENTARPRILSLTVQGDYCRIFNRDQYKWEMSV